MSSAAPTRVSELSQRGPCLPPPPPRSSLMLIGSCRSQSAPSVQPTGLRGGGSAATANLEAWEGALCPARTEPGEGGSLEASSPLSLPPGAGGLLEGGSPEPSKEGGRQEAEVTREKGKCQGSRVRASSKGQGPESIAGRGWGEERQLWRHGILEVVVRKNRDGNEW